MAFKRLLKKIVHRITGAVTSEDLNEYLRKHDITIGENTVFFDAKNTYVDTQRPWMLEIGDHCKITRGTVILQHDYSRSVLRRVYGDIVDGSEKTIIGSNVFIGMNSIILMGSHIGNNVIVGAGSVVSGKFPDNCVIAGNPARVIRSLEEHYHIRKEKYVQEAKTAAREFCLHYGKLPSIEDMGAFFPIYLARDPSLLKKYNLKTNLSGDDENDVIQKFLESDPLYDSFEDFLQDACGDLIQ